MVQINIFFFFIKYIFFRFRTFCIFFSFLKKTPILVADWGLNPPPVYGPVRKYRFFYAFLKGYTVRVSNECGVSDDNLKQAKGFTAICLFVNKGARRLKKVPSYGKGRWGSTLFHNFESLFCVIKALPPPPELNVGRFF